jgi:prepilin-type N-terminal cleavage/methylation domain-containing protein
MKNVARIDFHGEERRMSVTTRHFRALKRGFTLIETALATVIVGSGVLAIVAAQQAFHKQNFWSTHATIAARLGNEIREMTLQLPRNDPVTGAAFWGPEENETSDVELFDDLDDFDGDGSGLIFSEALGNGPLNARREKIANMEGWAQIVKVDNVEPHDITVNAPHNSTPMIRVTVTVTYQRDSDDDPVEMTRVSWVAPQ